jgi:hypothetical protein
MTLHDIAAQDVAITVLAVYNFLTSLLFQYMARWKRRGIGASVGMDGVHVYKRIL